MLKIKKEQATLNSFIKIKEIALILLRLENQKRNKKMIVVIPIERADQQTADQFTNILCYIKDQEIEKIDQQEHSKDKL